MKIKITWPTGIIIAITAFVIFILSFVYKVAFLPQYDHHLVSDEYYKEELNYQQEIDKLKNAAALEENITLKKVPTGLQINFPAQFNPEKIKGTIVFKRLSNSKIDFAMPIALKNHYMLIEDKKLVAGKWHIRIEWTVGSDTYLLKEKITY